MQGRKAKLSMYLKLLGKSRFRLFMEFPMLIRILFILFFCCGVYFLFKLPFSPSVTHYIATYVLFVMAGRWICRMQSPERILLTFLGIPVLWIKILKCLLLSLFVFVVDIHAGLIGMSLGALTVVLLPDRPYGNSRIASFYLRTSYQWLGMYRRTGIWVQLSGLLLLFIGLWHGNRNMSCFFLAWIIIIPCFFAFYAQPDPEQFIRVYKSSSYLLQRKLRESLINLLVPIVICLGMLLVFDASFILSYLKYLLLFAYSGLLLFYYRYVCYPHLLSALALFCITLAASFGLFFSYPYLLVILSILLLALLHILAVINLKPICAHGKTQSVY